MKKIYNIDYKSFTKNIFIIFLSLATLSILPNCAKYESKRLIAPNAPIHEKENIEVAKKTLTEDECKYYFGGRKLIERGYQPIQIYVKNNTDKTLYLDPNYITLPLESAGNVARKMYRDIGYKTTKYTLLFSPVWGVLEGISSYNANRTIASDLKEKSIRLDKSVRIRPHGILNKILFVAKENYNSDFKLSLINPKVNKKLDFNL